MTHVLLIECPDRKGLIYDITKILFEHNLNIIRNDEFVDNRLNQFYLRAEIAGEFNQSVVLAELSAALPAGVIIKLTPQQQKDIVILVTKEHHCIGDLLLRYEFGDLPVNIRAVIGNYDILQPLVARFNIPFHYVSHEGKTREAHDTEIAEVIRHYNPEYVVLAKYMRVLNPKFVEQFPNRIINIHHSFLPAFVGANPYKQAYERGVKIIGATAHFVSNELDEGPIIAQNVIQVNHSHSARDMAQAGRDVEKIVLAQALKLVFTDKVFVSDNKTIIF